MATLGEWPLLHSYHFHGKATERRAGRRGRFEQASHEQGVHPVISFVLQLGK